MPTACEISAARLRLGGAAGDDEGSGIWNCCAMTAAWWSAAIPRSARRATRWAYLLKSCSP